MINPVDYLWYKIYKAQYFIEKSRPVTDATFTGLVLGINMCNITLILYGHIPETVYPWCIVFTIILALPYASPKKQLKIIKKYRSESEKSRITGNIIVTIFIIQTFLTLWLLIKHHIIV